MHFLFLILTFLFWGCDGNKFKTGNTSNDDSINKYLKWASNDTLPFAERGKWNQKALELINLDKNDTLVRWYLCQVACNFSTIRYGEEYNKISKIHFKKSTEAKDTLNIARYNRYKGGYYIWKRRYDSAFYFHKKAERYYKAINDSEGLAKSYFYEGLLQYNQDDYLGAELSMKQAYNLIKEKPKTRFNYQILSQLGIIEDNLKNHNEAIRIHQATLKLATDLNLSPKLYKYNFTNTSLNNIGNSYKEQKQYKRAIYYFEKAIADKRDYKYDPLIFAYLYTNLGYCRMQLDDSRHLPGLFEKSVGIFDSLGIKNECAVSHVYLSDYYFKQKDTLTAIAHSQKALKLAKEANAPYYYLIALSQAGAVNMDKAAKYIQDYHRISDSLQFEQRKARSQFYKIQLETDELAQEKEKAIKQKWLLASAISGILVIVILLFVIYRQRTRQEELALRQMQQKTNEEIYRLRLNEQSQIEEARRLEKNRIARELHDGVINKLANIRIKLSALSKKNDTRTIAKCLKYIEDIHNIENEIRSLSHNLSRGVFTERKISDD